METFGLLLQGLRRIDREAQLRRCIPEGFFMKVAIPTLTRTGVLITVLIIVQYFGFFTGIRPVLVNLVLAFAAFTLPPAASLMVAAISPLLAFIMGLGSLFLPMLPVIIASNLAFVIFCGYFTGNYSKVHMHILGCILGSFLKFFILFFSVLYLIPYFFPVYNVKYKALITLFSFPQFVFALIGSLLALIIMKFFPYKRMETIKKNEV